MHVTRRRATRAARLVVFNLHNLTTTSSPWHIPKRTASYLTNVASVLYAPKISRLKQQSRYVLIHQNAQPETHGCPKQLAAVIEEYGGEPSIHQNSPEKNDTIQSTHIVSNTINFLTYDLACNALIPVVKPSWVHTSLAKRKIANPRQHSPDPRLFLNDVVVTCGDIPEGDKDAIIGGVLAKGGLYSPRVTGMVTHLVDLTADSDKAKLVQVKKMRVKIVLPHWYVLPASYYPGRC